MSRDIVDHIHTRGRNAVLLSRMQDLFFRCLPSPPFSGHRLDRKLKGEEDYHRVTLKSNV